MLKVTATDLKTNLGKYLTLVSHEDIHITKNGIEIAVMRSPKRYVELKLDEADKLSEQSDVRLSHKDVFTDGRGKSYE